MFLSQHVRIVFIAFAFLVGLALPAHAEESSLDWLAFGDLRGHWESCGCDPQTDLGGISRLAAYLDRERQAHPAALVFDLGNNFGPSQTNDPLKDRYMALGLSQLKASGVLVSAREFSLEPAFWQDRPLVLSNAKREQSKLNGKAKANPLLEKSQAYLVRPKALIFGYFWQDDLAAHLHQWDKNLELEIQTLRAKHSGLHSVLLFRGPDSQLKAAVQSGLFQSIILGNPQPASALPGSGEKEANLIRQVAGRSMPVVPLGGLGVLRGGRLKNSKEAPSLRELLTEQKQALSHATAPTLLAASPSNQLSLPAALGGYYPVSWLGLSYAGAGPLLGLVAQYEKETKELFVKRSQARLSQLASSPFAGAAACQTCHPKAYQAWLGTKHAHAYKTLKDAGKHEDPACVSCHVLGLDVKGGFVSEQASPQFAGVQCEACHGERREHSQNPSAKKPQVAASLAACVSCHHNPHSPSFDPKAYWERIKH